MKAALRAFWLFFIALAKHILRQNFLLDSSFTQLPDSSCLTTMPRVFFCTFLYHHMFSQVMLRCFFTDWWCETDELWPWETETKFWWFDLFQVDILSFFCCCCQIMMTCYFKIMTGVCEFPAFSLPLCLELFNPTLYIYSQYRAARKNNLIRLESGPISCSVVHLKEMKVKLYFFVYIEKILPNQSKSPSLNSIIY